MYITYAHTYTFTYTYKCSSDPNPVIFFYVNNSLNGDQWAFVLQ